MERSAWSRRASPKVMNSEVTPTTMKITTVVAMSAIVPSQNWVRLASGLARQRHEQVDQAGPHALAQRRHRSRRRSPSNSAALPPCTR
jgi:hypothetical protein